MKAEKDETKWAKKIVDDYGKEIPIFKNFKTGELSGGGTIQVRVPATWINEGETLIYMSKKEFKTLSEVWRAQLYIGKRILYHIIKNGVKSEEDETIFNIIQGVEKMNKECQSARLIVETIEKLYNEFRDGYIDKNDLDRTIDQILSNVKFNVKKRVEKVLYDMKNGKDLKDYMVSRENKNNLAHLSDYKEEDGWE